MRKNASSWAVRGALLLLTLTLAATAAQATRPAAPTGLEVEANEPDSSGTYSITLTWNSVQGAVSYNVYYRDLSDTSGNGYTLLGSPTTTSYTVTDATLDLCCAVYGFRVTATNNNPPGTPRESQPSNVVSTVLYRPYPGDFTQFLQSGAARFVSEPSLSVAQGGEYRYDADVVEEFKSSKVEYTLTRGPEGMTVDPATGVVTWQAATAGRYSVAIAATIAGTKETSAQSWALEVLDGVAGVDDEAAAAGAVRLYPNPAVSRLTLDPGTLRGGEIRVTSIAGQTMQTANTGSAETITLDVSAYPTGLYFLTIRNEGVEKTIPFTIAR